VASTNGAGDLNAGPRVTLTVNLSEAVTVRERHADAEAQRWAHGDLHGRVRHQCPDLQLHGGGRANTSDLTVTALNLNSATIADGAGNAANLTGAVTNPAGTLQIDTTPLPHDQSPPTRSSAGG